jgi:hypothetical protein
MGNRSNAWTLDLEVQTDRQTELIGEEDTSCGS